MTAHGDSNTAIEAMKSGAFDYVLKPIDFQLLLPQIEMEPHLLFKVGLEAATVQQHLQTSQNFAGHAHEVFLIVLIALLQAVWITRVIATITR